MKLKPRLLDLFCGAGGAAMGYHRAGFEVVGVDIKPQPHFPFEFHKADAMTYPLDGFDVIHASPPCQRYSRCTPERFKGNHPDLMQTVREKLTGHIFIIENVQEARKKLNEPLMLCGSMFKLPIRRHRYFEINPPLFFMISPCNHKTNPVYISGSTGSSTAKFHRRDFSVKERRDAMEVEWMTDKEIDQAIPPAYTEFIGKKIIDNMREIMYLMGKIP